MIIVSKKIEFGVFLLFWQEDEDSHHLTITKYPSVGQAIKDWLDYQDGQKILLTTPTVLVGYRIEVYRAEGTTQWYTAVIQSYNHATKVCTNYTKYLHFTFFGYSYHVVHE